MIDFEHDVLETTGGRPVTFLQKKKSLLRRTTRYRNIVLVSMPGYGTDIIISVDDKGLADPAGPVNTRNTSVRSTVNYVRYDVYSSNGSFDVTMFYEDEARGYAANAKPYPSTVIQRTVRGDRVELKTI